MENTKQLKRGDNLEGGLYVGTTKAGVQWVAYDEERFAAMCDRFDQTQTVKLTGVRGGTMMQVAEYLHQADQENGNPEARRTKITATTITAPRSFMVELAERLREEAEQWACGSRTIAENCFSTDMDWRFEEAANLRLAKSLKRWAAKIERRIAR